MLRNTFRRLPAFYQMSFDQQRFIVAVLIFGSYNGNFEDSKNWKVTVGNKISDVTMNQLFASYSDPSSD